MNIVERIQQRYDSLTETEREAADFILGHMTDVLLSTSAELSELCGISQPTLSRLYRKLGYHSSGDFKRDVRRYHHPGAPEVATANITAQDAIQQHLAKDIEGLRRTCARLSPEELDAIADRILDARQVAVIGLRNNYAMALHLREQLVQSRPRVSLLPQPGQSIGEEIVDLTGEDIAIMFGVRRRTSSFTPIATSLHKHDVPIIMVGDSTLRRTAMRLDATFLETDIHAQVLSSFTAAFSLTALLANIVATRALKRENVTSTRAGLTRIEAINESYSTLRELE